MWVRHKRRTIAFFAILALVARMLALLVPTHAAVQSASTIVDPVLGVLTICAVGDIGGGSKGEAPERNSGDHCPACILAKALFGAVLLAVAFILGAAPSTGRLIVWWSAAPLPLHLASGSVRCRAPPLPA